MPQQVDGITNCRLVARQHDVLHPFGQQGGMRPRITPSSGTRFHTASQRAAAAISSGLVPSARHGCTLMTVPKVRP